MSDGFRLKEQKFIELENNLIWDRLLENGERRMDSFNPDEVRELLDILEMFIKSRETLSVDSPTGDKPEFQVFETKDGLALQMICASGFRMKMVLEAENRAKLKAHLNKPDSPIKG